MFDKSYEDRLAVWREFREDLETTFDPLQKVIDFYNQAPRVSIHTDPWDENTWPSPWELINENQYCDFTRVLGMCYSLQLTERFKHSKFEIHISTENNLGYLYLLFIDNFVIGWDDNSYVKKDDLPAVS